mmetsp:Transcript_43461/g.136283  ORF Transcript_43461/g.136283 Transcript_43461/m.136283 type:complete len:427 (+) Transcript_43461:265-1545(+)
MMICTSHRMGNVLHSWEHFGWRNVRRRQPSASLSFKFTVKSPPSSHPPKPETKPACACLVRVVGHEGGGGGGSTAGATAVDATLGLGVGLRAGEERGLGGRDVLVSALPGLEHRLLQRAAVGEGEGPRLDGVDLVHGVEREGGILLGHAAGEEGDARHGHRHGVLEHAHGGEADLLHGGGVGAAHAGTHHVRLEEGALEHHVVVGERLVAGGEDLLGNDRGGLDAVLAVHEHLRLDDGHEAVRLADGGVAREGVRVLVDGELARGGAGRVLDVEHRAPLGEAGASGVVLGAALAEVGDALGHGLAVGAEERLHALVHLDARDDASSVEQVHERRAVVSVLVEGLLEHDGAGDVLAEALGLVEELAVLAAVFLIVLHGDRGEALADRAGGLVRSKDALARGGDVPRSADELGGVLAHGCDGCLSGCV